MKRTANWLIPCPFHFSDETHVWEQFISLLVTESWTLVILQRHLANLQGWKTILQISITNRKHSRCLKLVSNYRCFCLNTEVTKLEDGFYTSDIHCRLMSQYHLNCFWKCKQTWTISHISPSVQKMRLLMVISLTMENW